MKRLLVAFFALTCCSAVPLPKAQMDRAVSEMSRSEMVEVAQEIEDKFKEHMELNLVRTTTSWRDFLFFLYNSQCGIERDLFDQEQHESGTVFTAHIFTLQCRDLLTQEDNTSYWLIASMWEYTYGKKTVESLKKGAWRLQARTTEHIKDPTFFLQWKKQKKQEEEPV